MNTKPIQACACRLVKHPIVTALAKAAAEAALTTAAAHIRVQHPNAVIRISSRAAAVAALKTLAATVNAVYGTGNDTNTC